MRAVLRTGKFGAAMMSVAIAIGATGLAALPAGAAPPVGTGSISGRVVDSGGTPIQNICVSIAGYPSATTDSSGLYSLTGLPTGAYDLQYSDCNPNPTYLGQWYLGRTDPGSADAVNVVEPADTPLGEVTMVAGVSVQGRVTDTGGGPLQGICVEAAVPNGSGNWDWVGGSVQTQSNGTYSLGGLPAADLRVHFRDCASGTYIEQWWNAQGDFANSTPIVLASGELRQGIDAQLSTGTAVSGRVTDGLGNPIANVGVSVNPTDNGSSAFAQTDPAGVYTTNALPPGTYTVQFQGTPSFAGQFWNDKLSRNDADVLTITGADGPVVGNIDAVLVPGATISGRVTDDGGNPIANICVYGVIDTSDGFDGIGWANTAVDGTYTMSGVPPTTVKLVFQDCNTVGPFVQEWWDDATTPETATPITVASGDVRTGIDAELQPAGAITGRVTDGGGNPIEGVCAQASTATSVGNLATTDSNGDYAIVLAAAGDYKVQFVDCGRAGFTGEWWNDQPGPTTAQAVQVDSGQVVTGIDASLAPGAPGSISGRVVNAGGTPMTTSCVLAYLPYQFVVAGVVQPDGTYTIPNVPSGTYALAFLGCGSGGEPQPTVPDPDISGVEYSAFWWNGAPLDIEDSGDGGVDPIAQGANLVTLTPGTDLVGYDGCFGCTAITITSVTPGPNSLTVAFTTPFASGSGSSSGASVAGVSVAASGGGVSVDSGVAVTYTVTCASPSGGVTGSASGPGSPITVSGLTSGGSYVCRVAAAAGGVVFATSAASDVLAAGVTSAGASGAGDPASESGMTGSLPRTGATSSTSLARAGFFLLLVGMVLTATTRRKRVCLSR